jgi:hypothetical protein
MSIATKPVLAELAGSIVKKWECVFKEKTKVEDSLSG